MQVKRELWRQITTANGAFIRRHVPGRRLRPGEFMHWHNEVEAITLDGIEKGVPPHTASEIACDKVFEVMR